MGAAFFHSIPHRLNIPLISLVYFQLALLLTSSILSVLTFSKTRSALNQHEKIILTFFSIIIHYFVFSPTLYTTLTDSIAGLLFLLAIWSLFLGNTGKGWLILTGGVLLGLSAWIRAFYLYPIFGGLLIFFIYWLTTQPKNFKTLLVFIALLPICSQYLATYNHTGKISYLSPKDNKKWTKIHLSSTASGYDTLISIQSPFAPLEEILIQRGHLPNNYLTHTMKAEKDKNTAHGSFLKNKIECIDSGMLIMMKNFNICGTLSLTYERIKFYFGSYSSSAYVTQKNPRVHSWPFLLSNTFLFILAIIYFINLTATHKHSAMLIGSILTLIFAESLVIIPEQRFIIALQAIIYIFSLFQIFIILKYERVSSIFTNLIRKPHPHGKTRPLP